YLHTTIYDCFADSFVTEHGSKTRTGVGRYAHKAFARTQQKPPVYRRFRAGAGLAPAASALFFANERKAIPAL
ncbi:MAG TPA: hypothetical protein VN417_00980, partial [Candidatus Cryosericum sp.]|nr:hypothetical protein [Candidatus Cryosericum sp.]